MVVYNPQVNATSTYLAPVLAVARDVGFVQTGSAQKYQGGSVGLERFMLSVFTTGQIGTWPSPCGSNCTYDVSFEAPAVSCVPGNPNGTNAPTLSFDAVIYNATVVYPSTSNDSWPTGLLVTTPGDGTANIISCSLYTSTYQITVQYENNNATVRLQNPTLGQLISPSVANSGFLEDVYIFPDSGTYNGTSFGDLWNSINQYTLGYSFFDLLKGSVEFLPQGGYLAIDPTSFLYTNLLTSQDLATQIEDLFVNVTLSLLQYTATPVYLGQAFSTTDSPAAVFTSVQATTWSYPTLYFYSPAALWEIYGPALGVALLCILVGIVALLRNGEEGDASFLHILKATRHLTLDELSMDEMVGAAVSKKVKKTRVKFVSKGVGKAASSLFEILNS
jgi:hypothetical protein